MSFCAVHLAHIIQKYLSLMSELHKGKLSSFSPEPGWGGGYVWDPEISRTSRKNTGYFWNKISRLLAAQSPALQCSSTLGCLFFLPLALVSSSGTLDQCILWLVSRVHASWKVHFFLCDQRFSLKSCQGYNLSAHSSSALSWCRAWIGRRPVLFLWNWELNAIFSHLWAGTFQRVYSSEINLLVLRTRVCFSFPKTLCRQKTLLF